MIQVRDTAFAEAKLFIPDVYPDARGYFKESFSQSKYTALGLHDVWLQDSVSRSKRNVIRGMHYDMRMAKFVQVLLGSIFDVIVDVREGSPTYKRWQGFELTADNHHQLYVPKGFAHGFLAQSDDVIVHYKMSAEYDPRHEGVLSWRDAQTAIVWPLEGTPILSAKDAAA
ncbi:MAG: dTDP-4-dehydrorhamnose 3,5-epimerase [Candidatus Eremiobacteraeota bacterium]|nr:dTDP-4-dehydrorhamnose 3,5-epimerase [Candidatus Eremiobacteraeota bacterium]MBV8262375.1 dTDP-4-dehydrorhamnose 3,5-epimerase [Candidatus Eremiobacteraeota bacterium]MBV8595074.1 dTDP-4-dehydrorhamnose 3,5-epimerase [Candidatus Eremiobacteraeota bacterium]